jgi:signal transduction histidine kinase
VQARAESDFRRRTGAVLLLALAGSALGVWVLILKAQDGGHAASDTAFDGVSGFLFIIAGVIGHLRRPANRVGLVMVLVGLAWFAEDIQFYPHPVISGIGQLFADVSNAPLVNLVLLFPFGRFDSRLGRPLTVAAYAIVFGLTPISALFNPGWKDNNGLAVVEDQRVFSALARTIELLGAAVAVAVFGVLIARWITAKRPTRRVLAPVYLTGLVGAAATVAGGAAGPARWREIPLDVYKVTVVLLPLMFLAGLLRTHLGRTPVGDLLAELRRPLSITDLRDLLARTLGDPALRIVYQDAQTGAFVDSAGDAVADEAFPGYSTTPIERDGRAVATLVHDAGLDEDPHVLEAITAALGLALENDRLATEVRAQLDQVRESRTRIVAAGDELRRRLERDLHDGAQQQLVTAALTLQLAAQRLGGQLDPDATKLVGDAAELLDGALAELRRFARGVHPAVLTEAGLTVALEAMVARLPVPAQLRLPPSPLRRLDPQVEATAYFVAAEAVTNALKHAQAERLRVSAELIEDGRSLRVEVSDDGVGGADPGRGTGLTGLLDRVLALDGELKVISVPGAGTTVTAVLPTG